MALMGSCHEQPDRPCAHRSYRYAKGVKAAITEVLGEQERRSQKGWRDEEYDRAVAAKNLAYQKCLQRYQS